MHWIVAAVLLVPAFAAGVSGQRQTGGESRAAAPQTNAAEAAPGWSATLTPQSRGESPLVARSRRDPYGNIRFASRQQVPAADPSAPEAMSNGLSTPRVVCGLRMWRMDPGFDAGIRIPAPGEDTEFSVRRVKPTECLD